MRSPVKRSNIVPSAQHDDEAFVPGAFARCFSSLGANLDRHIVMGSPRDMNNPG